MRLRKQNKTDLVDLITNYNKRMNRKYNKGFLINSNPRVYYKNLNKILRYKRLRAFYRGSKDRIKTKKEEKKEENTKRFRLSYDLFRDRVYGIGINNYMQGFFDSYLRFNAKNKYELDLNSRIQKEIGILGVLSIYKMYLDSVRAINSYNNLGGV